MEQDQIRKSFWRDAAVMGTILGAVLSVTFVVAAYANINMGLVNLVLYVATFIYYGKKRAALYGGYGFTYGQGLGFMVASSIFAGVILGIVTYVVYNLISPNLYETQLMTVYDKLGESLPMFTDEMIEQSVNMATVFMRNPLFVIFSSILGTVFSGAFFGLFAAIFTKRAPDPFSQQ